MEVGMGGARGWGVKGQKMIAALSTLAQILRACLRVCVRPSLCAVERAYGRACVWSCVRSCLRSCVGACVPASCLQRNEMRHSVGSCRTTRSPGNTVRSVFTRGSFVPHCSQSGTRGIFPSVCVTSITVRSKSKRLLSTISSTQHGTRMRMQLCVAKDVKHEVVTCKSVGHSSVR